MTDQPSEPTADAAAGAGDGDSGAGAVGPAVDPAAIEAELDDVARALDRLDDGSYGTCEVCGAALAPDALAAAPAARRCPAHVTA